MNKFFNLLERQGIKKNIMDVLHRGNGTDIQSILEYEIQKDESLEDAFLQFAHAFGMKVICDKLEHDFLVDKLKISFEVLDKALNKALMDYAVKIKKYLITKTER